MEETGALLKGHFLLTSGLHSSHYLQCALLLKNTWAAALVGQALAEKASGLDPEVVVAPAMGGLIVGHEVARALGKPFIFCEREEGRLVLRRFPSPGPVRCLVVEDVITTGGSVKEVGRNMEEGGAEWVGTCVVVDRSGRKHVLPHQPISLMTADFPVYKPEECPLCQEGLELVKPGSNLRPGEVGEGWRLYDERLNKTE